MPRVKFVFYAENQDPDTVVAEGAGDSITVDDFKRIRELARTAGYSVTVNGEDGSPRLDDILAQLNGEGIALSVDGKIASGSTPIRSGSTLVAAGEVKGN